MNQEAGSFVDPRDILGGAAGNLEMAGVKGLIPLELSVEEVLNAARDRGYKVIELKVPGVLGTYIISSDAPRDDFLFLYTRIEGDTESCPHICDRDVGDFKRCFQGLWPQREGSVG